MLLRIVEFEILNYFCKLHKHLEVMKMAVSSKLISCGLCI